jgi:hypothetical protein
MGSIFVFFWNMQGKKNINDIMKPLLEENKKENGRKKKKKKDNEC